MRSICDHRSKLLRVQLESESFMEPVNYALRVSGPVTVHTARHLRDGVGAVGVSSFGAAAENVCGYDADPDLCGGFGTVWPDRSVADEGQGR